MKTIKRPNTQLNTKICSYQRTAEILGVEVKNIEFIVKLDNGNILVGLYNDCVTLSMFDYGEKIKAEEQEKAKNLEVRHYANNSFELWERGEKYSTVIVQLKSDFIKSPTLEYKELVLAFGNQKVADKFVYAVLNHLGYGSLKEYVLAHRKAS